jgi:hypothetical protein
MVVVAIWLPYFWWDVWNLRETTELESTKSNVFNRTRTWVELYESAALTS